MKKIEAVVQPFKMEEVKEALKNIGIDGMTISEVRGHGRQKGHKEVYRGQEYNVDLLPKVKFELVIPDTRLDEVVECVTTAARSGTIGDGKIFDYDGAEAIRSRNGDRVANPPCNVERRISFGLHCSIQHGFGRRISPTRQLWPPSCISISEGQI